MIAQICFLRQPCCLLKDQAVLVGHPVASELLWKATWVMGGIADQANLKWDVHIAALG